MALIFISIPQLQIKKCFGWKFGGIKVVLAFSRRWSRCWLPSLLHLGRTHCVCRCYFCFCCLYHCCFDIHHNSLPSAVVAATDMAIFIAAAVLQYDNEVKVLQIIGRFISAAMSDSGCFHHDDGGEEAVGTDPYTPNHSSSMDG